MLKLITYSLITEALNFSFTREVYIYHSRLQTSRVQVLILTTCLKVSRVDIKLIFEWLQRLKNLYLCQCLRLITFHYALKIMCLCKLQCYYWRRCNLDACETVWLSLHVARENPWSYGTSKLIRTFESNCFKQGTIFSSRFILPDSVALKVKYADRWNWSLQIRETLDQLLNNWRETFFGY